VTQHYRFAREIVATARRSQVPDVAWSPDGNLLAASYTDLDEVALLDARSGEVQRRYCNPQARFDAPHGVLLTERHLIVSNKLNPADRPAVFTVYDLQDPGLAPVTRFTTPRQDFCEAHSMALRDERLVCTYAGRGTSALACYRFDRASGRLSGPLAVVQDWFRGYGQPKGVAFSDDGCTLAVTFATTRAARTTLAHKWQRYTWVLRQKSGLKRLRAALRKRLRRALAPPPPNGVTNGVALFDIDSGGQIAATPRQIVLQPDYCRLENIHIVGQTCAVTDTINQRVMLFGFDGELSTQPTQVISERLSFPHDACLSPNGRCLLVSNNGLRIVNNVPHWHEFTDQRGDKVCVFELGD
tara:strand:+ start:4439 stop:5506 length:1068 start_codon:yes stop_codon:yes gene_type:complete